MIFLIHTVTEIAKELGVSSAEVKNKTLAKDNNINGTWILSSSYSDRIFYHSMEH